MTERSHQFTVVGDGTINNPNRYRCILCGFVRAVLSSHADLGCYDGLRDFYVARERAMFKCD